MNKRRYLLISLLIANVITSLFAPLTAHARSFDPGNIISDSIFTNSMSMSADLIQQFIVAKGSGCVDGAAPCLKNFTENGKSVGTIIAEVSQMYTINPQVILITIQKETGLLTFSQPGTWRYQSATGYGCPDSSPGVCDSSYYGFTNQITWTAKMFRAIMDNSPNWYTPYILGNNYVQYHPDTSCGGSIVAIQNRATQALYNYTPYQPNAASLAAGYGLGDRCSSYGNRNFWLFFNDWFGSSVSSMLLQSPQSQAVYLQSGNTRYVIPSWDIINAYGFGRFGVTPVSDAYINSLTDGGVLATTFSNKAQPGPVYLADNGYKFGFSTYQQCVDWGFPLCTNTQYSKALESSLFDQIATKGDVNPLMLNGSYVYLMSGGQKYPFLSHQAQVEQGYGTTPYTTITSSTNSQQPVSTAFPENNSLVSIKNTQTIYAYANKHFYALSWPAFMSLQASRIPLQYDTVSSYTQAPPITTGTVGSLIGFSDGKELLLTNTQKIDISPAKQNWPAAPVLDELKTVFTAKQPDLVVAADTTYRTANGTIFKVESQKWRAFQTIADYFALGYTAPMNVDSSILNPLTEGDPVFAPGNGTLYQVSTPDKATLIFTTSTDNTVCQLYSLPQLGLYGFDTSSVPQIAQLGSGTPKLLSTTTYDERGDLHIRYTNVHSVISAADLKTVWGISSPMSICSFSRSFQARAPITNASPRFVRNEHTGVIYFGEAGTKRPIYSYAAFLRMGGNSQNTQNVSMEFLVSSPDGSPIIQ